MTSQISSIYLDANACHPLLKQVRENLAQALLHQEAQLGNPSSIHQQGQSAKKLHYLLRKEMADYLAFSDPEQIFVNSGATEGINNVLEGFEQSFEASELVVLSSEVEHSAVLERLKVSKFSSLCIPVNETGDLDQKAFLESFQDLIRQNKKVLVFLQVANNETGILFELEELFKKLIEINPEQRNLSFSERQKTENRNYWIALDAAQALGKLPEDRLRRTLYFCDYALFSGHKIGAPTGVGLFWMRPGVPFVPLIKGAAQERKRRAGTQNTLGIYGFYEALKFWKKNSSEIRQRMQSFRERLHKRLQEIEGYVPHSLLDENKSLPNTLNFRFEDCLGASLLLALDLQNIYLSSGSACNSGSLRGSHVLKSMGCREEEALSALRLSIGAETTEEEIEKFLNEIEKLVLHIRNVRKDAEQWLPSVN